MTEKLPTLRKRLSRVLVTIGVGTALVVSLTISAADYCITKSLLIREFTHTVTSAANVYATLYNDRSDLSGLDEYLEGFSEHTGLQRLCAYDTQDALIASWQGKEASETCPSFLVKSGVELEGFWVHIAVPVQERGEYLGMMYADGYMISLHDALVRGIYLSLGLLLVAIVLSLWATRIAVHAVNAPLNAIRAQIECMKQGDAKQCVIAPHIRTVETMELGASIESLRTYITQMMVTREAVEHMRNWHLDTLSGLLAMLRHRLSADSPLLVDLDDYALLLQVERGDLLAPPMPFELAQLLDHSLATARAAHPLDPRRVHMTASLQAGIARHWEGQPAVMGALLRHMLLIGLKRTRDGFVYLRIEANKDRHLSITMEDTGPFIQHWQLQQWLSLAKGEALPAGMAADISWLLVARLFAFLGGTLTGFGEENGRLKLVGTVPAMPSLASVVDAHVPAASHRHRTPPLLLAAVPDKASREAARTLFSHAGCELFTLEHEAQAVAWAPVLPLSAIMLNGEAAGPDEDILPRLRHMAQSGAMPDVPYCAMVVDDAFSVRDYWQRRGVGEVLLRPLQPPAVKALCAKLMSQDEAFYLAQDSDVRDDLPEAAKQNMPEMVAMLAAQLEQMEPVLAALAGGEYTMHAVHTAHAVKSGALTLGYFRLAALMGEIEHAAGNKHFTSAPQNWRIISDMLKRLHLA